MINYQILHDSTQYYHNCGYNLIETPWTVSKGVMDITKPAWATVDFELKHNGKCLVASGEQSFLYLYLKGFLPKGYFQTITPCFRYESFDFLHSKYFIKNELINTEDVTDYGLVHMLETAKRFFSKYIEKVDIVKTSIGWDIKYKNYELGSYGIRKCEFLEWVYGTGVAEPRLSNIIRIANGVPQEQDT